MSTFYTTQLYPLQDKVLSVIARLNLPFYLTGGTALSRGYYQHRYSDDLDLFVNHDSSFSAHAESVINALQSHFQIAINHRSESFYSLLIEQVLKLDMVNDVAFRYGKNVKHEFYPKLDNVRNILSNKLSALSSRDEAKDVVDIWTIATHEQIDWPTIFTDVSSKAVGIFPPLIVERLHEFPLQLLAQIKWISQSPSITQFQKDIEQICLSILKPSL